MVSANGEVSKRLGVVCPLVGLLLHALRSHARSCRPRGGAVSWLCSYWAEWMGSRKGERTEMSRLGA